MKTAKPVHPVDDSHGWHGEKGEERAENKKGSGGVEERENGVGNLQMTGKK